DMGAHGLGIRLGGLSLHDVHPPQEVVPSYHAVARAMEDHDRAINDATAQATRQKRNAEAQAVRLVKQGQARAQDSVKTAQAACDVFLARHKARTQLSPEAEAQLLSAAAGAALSGQPLAAVLDECQRQRRQRLAVQAFLTDFRLFWEALAPALGQREKIVVDVDPAKIRGRRHIQIFDPEWFRPPLMQPPPLRGPRRPRGGA